MIANVNEQVWIDFGLETAVFLDTIAYWIKHNAANKQEHNFKEGRYWTYNTVEAYRKMFPGWSTETMRRIIRNCVKADLLIIDNFNDKKYDRTCWYSLTDKAIEYYPKLKEIVHHLPDKPSPASLVGINKSFVGINQPIPKELPSVSNINITSDNVSKTKKENELIADVVQAYHEELPDSPKMRVIDTSLKNQIRKMIKDWPKYEREGNKFTIESFIAYLRYIKSTYTWLTKPYITKQGGNTRNNNLRIFTREKTITQIINGEYSGN